MKTLHKKFLITKDQYEDKASSNTKMQAYPYHEEEYWKRKEARGEQLKSKLEKLDFEKLLDEIKKHEDK